MFTDVPQPPYYAVIFTSKLNLKKSADYGKMADEMIALAEKQSGFLGAESVRSAAAGITVSYWQSEEDILRWKNNPRHKIAQAKGKTAWYDAFSLHICKVEHNRFFTKSKG